MAPARGDLLFRAIAPPSTREDMALEYRGSLAIAGKHLEDGLRTPNTALHGLIPVSDVPGFTIVFVPYLTVLSAVEQTKSLRRCDLDFRIGRIPLHDLVQELLRSIQLLGVNRLRFLESIVRDTFTSASGETGWGSDYRDPYGFWHAGTDVKINIDSIMNYSRVIGDAVGRTLLSLFSDPPYRGISRTSFRGLMNNVRKAGRKSARSPWAPLFEREIEWIEILARHVSRESGSVREGIRDARLHHGAMNVPLARWSDRADGKLGSWEFGAQQPGPKGFHSTDLIADLGRAVSGLFRFLDDAVRLAIACDPELAPDPELVRNGLVWLYGPIDFVSTMLPLVGSAEVPTTS